MARLFNGSSDITNNGSVNIVPSGNSWSASAWVYVVSYPASGKFGTIIAKRNNGSACFEIFFQNNAGTVGYGAYNGTNFLAFGNLSTTGTWVHYASTCDGASAINYQSGSVLGTDARSYVAGNSPTTPISIGGDFSASLNLAADWLNARLADVAVWNNVKLTANEIAALAQGARPYMIRPTALVLWCPLDGLQSPEPDLSLGKNNATLTGTASAFGPPLMQFTPRWPVKAPIVVPAVAVSPFLAARAMRANQVYTGYATQ